MLLLISSCDLDQVTIKYQTYSEAEAENFFDKGWIPRSLIFESMSDIYLRSNIDLNTCIFSYQVDRDDLIVLESRIEPSKAEFAGVRRIKIPKEWLTKVEELNDCYFVPSSNTDTVLIKIDKSTCDVIGWID